MNKHEPSTPSYFRASLITYKCLIIHTYIHTYICCLQSSFLEFGGNHSRELHIRICEVGKAASSFDLGHLPNSLRHCWIFFCCCSVLLPYCLTSIFFNSLELGFEYFLNILPGFCPQPFLARARHHPQHIAIPFLHFHMICMIFFVFVCACYSRTGL